MATLTPPDDPVVPLGAAINPQPDQSMTFTTIHRTIEITRGSLHLNFPSFGLFLERDAAAPLLGFEKESYRDDWEVWCLGCHIVFDRQD